MALGTLEIIALITIGIALIKIITLMINPKSWFDSTKKLFVNVKAAQFVSLVLAAVLLYFLIRFQTVTRLTPSIRAAWD